MAAPVTHFEINAKDGQRMRDFYSAVFDWKIEMMPDAPYGMVDTGIKMGINGGIGQIQPEERAGTTFYIQVEDVQSYLDKAIGLGAMVIKPLTEVPGMVTFAQFTDPEGNVIGLVKGPQTLPKEAKPKRKVAPKKASKKKKVVARKKSRK